MSQSYYRVIDGHKYDSEMIELADRAVAGRGDGRISLEDAKLLLAAVKDANKYTDIEKETMHYIRDHYRFTPAADKWFRTQIRSWAAIRGRAGHSADTDRIAAEAYEAEPATAVVSPPPTEIPGEPESHQSHEEAPPQATPAPPATPPAQATPAPPQAAATLPQATAARPGSRAKWLIPLAAGGAILAAILLFVFWPSPPPPPAVEAPVREAPQPPAQAVAAAPAPAEPASTELQAPQPAESAGTEREQSQAVETAPAAGEIAAVARESQAPGVAAPGVPGGTHIVERGDTLWAIAATWYSDALLWPWIFRANQERMPNPDLIHPGVQISVPTLQGTASALTAADRSGIAEGYVAVYRAYLRLGSRLAQPFLLEARRRDPAVVQRMEAQRR
ncbi:MAG: LysM peptidoglycan-binding domain-containing protein [SAR324 cluster bacterium]|nr:LysM peptidoglycan-binding domain-containing protein [SAR324 cluster bacterium]